jgi:hypothetical protein
LLLAQVALLVVSVGCVLLRLLLCPLMFLLWQVAVVVDTTMLALVALAVIEHQL